MRSCPIRRLAAGLLLAATATTASAQQFDPAHSFKTSRTLHFTIHFHEGTERLASRLAVIAEETWSRFAARAGIRVPSMTHVVFVDQSESANGFATPVPRNLIVLYASAPSIGDLLNPDDWLRTLFVHEFTHIVHLDRADGWAGLAHKIFGRAPWTFPNSTLPLWHIEGLATWEESTTPGPPVGRLHAGDFLAVSRLAAGAGSMPALDRIGGGVTDWPGGLAPYAYGVSFHAWLARRYGAETFEPLSAATSRRLPWLGTFAFRKIYGQSLSALWREYAAESEATHRRQEPPATPPRRLTTDGFVASGPRLLPKACDTCPPQVVYSRRTPHDRPGLHVLDVESLTERRIATRMTGRTSAIRDGRLYFDQGELIRNSGPYSDLYALDLRTEAVARLTSNARLRDPDLAPDGDVFVATQHGTPGQRDLVLVRLATGAADPATTTVTPLVAAVDAQFDGPRWSPDGRTIAVSRQLPNDDADIVLVDANTHRVDVLTSGSGLRWTTPTWRPDGHAVVAAGAAADDAFDLYEIPLDTRTPRRLTQHAGGATWPEVLAERSTLVYVGHGIDGFDLYEVPYDAAGAATTGPIGGAENAPPTPGTVALPPTSPATAAESDEPVASSPYSPWSTVVPTFWSPLVTLGDDARIGATVGGADVLGYHLWAAGATWPVADRGAGTPGRAGDWSASYLYGRWRVQPWLATARSTSVFRTDTSSPDPDLPSSLVEQTTEAGLRVIVERLRRAYALQISMARAVDTLTRGGAERHRNRSGIRAAWRYASAQRPGYAISPERGLSAGGAVELVRPAFGASGQSATLTIDGRAYLPGLAAHHVVAVRGMRGVTWGDEGVRRLFILGGGAATRGPGSLSSEAGRLLRGYSPNAFAGRQVLLVNADYRLPLVRPQRGFRAWPLLVHSVHGAIVADIGDTWNTRLNWRGLKSSIGAELSVDVVVGYRLPLTVAAGVARGYDHSGRLGPRTTTYVRLGHAF